MRRHLADRAQRSIRGRTHEAIGNECTERTCGLKRMAGTQEQTSTERASNLREASMRICDSEVKGRKMRVSCEDVLERSPKEQERQAAA